MATVLTPHSEHPDVAAAEPAWVRRHWNVPRADRAALIEPALSEIGELLHKNQALLESPPGSVLGRPFSDLRTAARKAALEAARDYTSLWGDVSTACKSCTLAEAPIVLSGHQPQLFHVGVWFKNFVAGKIAREHHAIGLNLVVDSDMCSTTALRLPAPHHARPRYESALFDTRRPGRPWEEMQLHDRELFRTFPQRLAETLAPWGFSPLLETIWPEALKLSEKTDRLADLLTAARNQQERRWGCRNLELPISRLCQTEPFLWFVLAILDDLPRFQQIYNEVLAEYRRINGVRSHTHPVPPLHQRENRLEAPFRVWWPGETRRRPLFAGRQGEEIVLSDDATELLRLKYPKGGDPRPAIVQLRDWQNSGARLRTRALTTTLYTRLFLGDLFLHGIGGSKYDEMTDRLMTRFFGIPAPGYVTVSASLFLPLNPFTVARRDLDDYKQQFHWLQWAPEQCAVAEDLNVDLAVVQNIRELTAELEPLQQDADRRRHLLRRRDLHRRLRELRARIAPQIKAAFDTRALPRWKQLGEQLQANQILANREYSLALFPEQLLHGFLQSQELL